MGTLKDIIETMNQEECNIKSFSDGVILRVTFGEGKDEKPRFFGYKNKRSERIGFGSESLVFKAHEIDVTTGKYIEEDKKHQPVSPVPGAPDTKHSENKQKRYVVKYIDYSKDPSKVALEAELNRSFFECSNPITTSRHRENDQHHIIMEYLDGQDILPQDTEPDMQEIHKLPYYWRIKIAYLMIEKLNYFHNGSKSHPPIIHRDIKGNNFRVHVKKNDRGEVIDVVVYLLDFGIAQKISEKDPSKIYESKTRGTYAYMAPELMTSKFVGIKSDIYSLSGLIGTILGAIDPVKNKRALYIKFNNVKERIKNVKQDRFNFRSTFVNTSLPERNSLIFPELENEKEKLKKEITQADFDFSDLFASCPLPNDFPSNIKELTIAFLNRGQNQRYHKRPTSDEALQYLKTLNNLCNLHRKAKKTSNDELLIATHINTLKNLLFSDIIADIKKYKKNKRGLLAENGRDSYERTCFGYTNGQKYDAAQFFLNCFQKGKHHLIFKREYRHHLRALETGRLGEITKPILQFLKKQPQHFSHQHTLLFFGGSTNTTNALHLPPDPMRHGKTLLRA